MKQSEFEVFIAAVCADLGTLSKENPVEIAACKSGEDFEDCVYGAILRTILQWSPSLRVSYNRGSHRFPDFVLNAPDGSRYGIEVKSSSAAKGRGWKINGNSILGSTKEDVDATYLLFGKTASGQQAFRWKRYEDCVSGVAVTHSPRYMIDMDVATGATFFDKLGMSYRQFSEEDQPIEKITAYYRAQGQQAWWLAESTPAALRMYADLAPEEQRELLGYCFAHFPEVFSCNTKKFFRCAMWLVSERSIVSPSLRDSFTAGGRVSVAVGGQCFEQVPHIFGNLQACRQEVLTALDNATAEELVADWGAEGQLCECLSEKVAAWCVICGRKFCGCTVNGYEPEELLKNILVLD